MEKEVHIRQREAVPATGSTLQLMPTGKSNSEVYEIDYFCLTGEVDESAKNWIRLYSSVMPEGHTGEERIIVEDGKIYIKVLPNVEAIPETESYISQQWCLPLKRASVMCNA